MDTKNAWGLWGPGRAAHITRAAWAQPHSAQVCVHPQESSLAPAHLSFLPWFKICQMGRQGGDADSARRAGEQGGEHRRPTVLVNLEVSDDLQEKGKDSVCIRQLMLCDVAVTNIPGSRSLALQNYFLLTSHAGNRPGLLCVPSFSWDPG